MRIPTDCLISNLHRLVEGILLVMQVIDEPLERVAIITDRALMKNGRRVHLHRLRAKHLKIRVSIASRCQSMSVSMPIWQFWPLLKADFIWLWLLGRV